LYEIYGELPIKEAFSKADDVLTTAAKSIAEIITRPGYINVDFADVRRAMERSGVAIMGTGSASGPGRALEAVESALLSPLLNNSDIAGAKNVLVNITASEKALMSELNQIMMVIQDRTGGDMKFIKRGIVFDNSLGDAINVTVVATGFGVRAIPLPDIDMIVNRPGKEEERITLSGDAWPNADVDIPDRETFMEGEKPFEVHELRKIFMVDNEDDPTIPSPVEVTIPVAGQPATQQAQRMKPQRRPVLRPENEADILELEKIPAYKRKNKQLSNAGTQSAMSRKPTSSTKLTQSLSGEYRVSIGSPFLDTVD